ncbi:polysaccharide pyruvyl transferase family protein [Phocaeicola coprophilus]|uniref:polysaccharide pyruvyl transferase family protein n=1 Tax=Phocaeicola coprophilus TaxID=387090 RepID=UPI002430F06D|nr:polysaccharide pyruvyl transferase family protein [Phocaeicola coprophilus]
MKIGILTLPIKSNYGGILQAYALLTVLRKHGHDAWLIRRRWNSENQSKLHKLFKQVYHALIIRTFNKFIKQYIQPQTEIIDTRYKAKGLLSKGFEAFVVGSDQVWRMRHVYGADYNYFLDFTKNANVKRLAYAASFGVDYWDDTNPDKSIPIVKELLQKFDAISVREDSGIELCRNLFGVKAQHVLDPTLLLNKEDYINQFSLNIKQGKYIAVYILDMTKEKQQLINSYSVMLNLPIKYINRTKLSSLSQRGFWKELCQPGIESWLGNIANASFVITDSFHGTAFSINFERQFISIANEKRGLDRFLSLLKQFGLENRLLKDTCTKPVENKMINYDLVKELLNNERSQSTQYLINNLR